MVLKGHIYRGRKPVHWSPSSRTALAEAELEYPEGHKSKSIYVTLPVASVADGAPDELRSALEGAAFAVWTTTPWTMPANMAVAVNKDLQYSVVEVRQRLSCAVCGQALWQHYLIAVLLCVSAMFPGTCRCCQAVTMTSPFAQTSRPVHFISIVSARRASYSSIRVRSCQMVPAPGCSDGAL